MKHPKCRTCGKAHRVGPCDFEAVLNDLADDGLANPLPDDIKLVPTLTPAQKQKAYRERHGDRVREADKLRMRKKRGG